MSFNKGVNFTAGLSVIRTSPDHGTAFDIAGKNIANYSSFRAAVYAACDIHKNRREYLSLNENSLKFRSHSEKK
jgi:4-hydroxythreonine-4-phosphate dehydrogenase